MMNRAGAFLEPVRWTARANEDCAAVGLRLNVRGAFRKAHWYSLESEESTPGSELKVLDAHAIPTWWSARSMPESIRIAPIGGADDGRTAGTVPCAESCSSRGWSGRSRRRRDRDDGGRSVFMALIVTEIAGVSLPGTAGRSPCPPGRACFRPIFSRRRARLNVVDVAQRLAGESTRLRSNEPVRQVRVDEFSVSLTCVMKMPR